MIGMTAEDDTNELWFWYNPSLDSLVRTQAPSRQVHGLFDSESEAREYLEHTDDYPNATHLELYKAIVSLKEIEQIRSDTGERTDLDDQAETIDQMNVLDQRTLQQFVEGDDQ